ncbi:MAG: translocation/assembly module TamB [Bacteroidales bacterium]|nr:translocation/assembly module TamB [Bacteroidales bacterium]
MIIFLLVIIVIPTTAFFVLKSSKIQTFLTQKITKEISENLNAKFEVEAVHFKFFNRIVLKNVYIEDQLEDTLLFSKEIICNLNDFDRKSKIININKINFINAKLYLHKYDSLQPVNLKFITESLQKRDTLASKSKWKVLFQNIGMQQSVFRLKLYNKNRQSDIDFGNLICEIDDLDIRNFQINNGIATFYLKKLTFEEKSGFSAYNVKFNVSIGKEHMKFSNVKIRTPNSYINSDSLSFRHNDYFEYREFAKNIILDFTFQESNISFIDIGYFVPVFKNIELNTVLSGRVYSKLSTFKGKNVKFQIGEQTELITDFSLNGLPDYSQMFMYFDFKKLTTQAQDFELINKFLNNGKEIIIPERFNQLGIISYKGNFAGFYDDFVTYGKFTSDLGNISTDLSLQPDTSKTLAFSGNLKTTDFFIGQLVPENNKIGKITMDARIKGSVDTKKTIKATTDGTIHSIEINNYNYQNIIIDGFLTEKTYDGYFSISDPNIKIDFSGDIDFSKEIPIFNFNANIPHANLYGLNIDKNDSTSNLSLNLQANFEGIDVDNAFGEISFSDATLHKLNENLVFDTLRLISKHFADTHRIELKSDYIDALLTGEYKSTSLVQSLKNLYFNYLPALINQSTDTISLDYNNNFTLDLKLKKTEIITRFFLPSVFISDSSNIIFKYNSEKKRFLLNAFANEFSYKNHTFNDLNISTFSNDSIFTSLTKCNSLLLNNYFFLEKFKTTSIIHNNNIDFKIDWDNEDTVVYEGKILASVNIMQKNNYDDPLFNITVLPSSVIVKDSLWYINKSYIKIDSTSYSINNFAINHGDQNLKVNGKISENQEDTLFLSFGKLNLANINALTKDIKLEFRGIINGESNFSDLYKNPLFYANIEIDNLILNSENFGYMQIFSRWIDKDKAIQLEASTIDNEKRTLNVSGNYYPADKSIKFNIILDKLGLHVLNPYLKSFASNVSGKSDGSILVNGTLKKPEFNGILYAHDAAMTIDYLKTSYKFTTEVIVENNSMKFNNVNLLDSYQNIGKTNGLLKFGPRKDISFNFDIDVNNLHSLNTTVEDNESFYGSAFMSGIVSINGNRDNTFIDISAKTEKDTKISIPLIQTSSANEMEFLTFINKSEVKVTEQDDYNIDFKGFGLNFELEITPDVEAQLIFDSKIGDVIRGKGEGDLKMEIDAENNFKMYGDFTIEEGDYLFTLQNVINKKFKIKRGGNIIWNGEPYDANVDFEAVYNLKASLNSLVIDTSYYTNKDYYKKRIPVECQVYLSNKLMNPDIQFDINLPTADEETKTLIKTAVNTEEKLNKQFLSLLVLNSFMPAQTGSDIYFTDGSSTAGIGTVTTSELLSNQLSHWLSQISDEWDIGVNYRPGDEISKDQVEVALSTQLLDDRVSINGNVGYGGQTVDQATNIVGDFNVDVKLNKSGKLRVKAFNESNDKLLYENAPYTQGVGIFYREEFNTFSELMKKFWNRIIRKKKENTND